MKIYYDNIFFSVGKLNKLLNGFFLLSLPVEKENNEFSSQNIVILSQNNVPKYHPGQHENDL